MVLDKRECCSSCIVVDDASNVVDEGVTAEQLGSSGTPFLAAWLFFQIAANHVFLPILIITFLFAKRAARHPAVINVCLTWVMSGIMSSIL